MKSNFLSAFAGACLLTTAGAATSPNSPTVASPTSPTAQAPHPAAAASDSTKVAPASAAPASRESEALEAASRMHIRPARVQVKVDTPPPAPRTEKKPPAPTTGMVWVPGHWAPVSGQWQWKPGVWGFPATPISVWIEAKYDEKTKQWTAGYWQPDREEPYDQEPPKEAPPPTEKFF